MANLIDFLMQKLGEAEQGVAQVGQGVVNAAAPVAQAVQNYDWGKAVPAGIGAYLASSQPAFAGALDQLQKEALAKKKTETDAVIDLLGKGYAPYEPQLAQTQPEFMKTGKLSLEKKPFPPNTFNVGTPIGGSKYVSQVPKPEANNELGWAKLLMTMQKQGQNPGEKPLTKQQIFYQENMLRNQFNNNPGVREWPGLLRQYKVMEAAFSQIGKSQSKNAIDQALIMTFNKMLDPGSVVRESEYARLPEGIAAINRAEGFLKKLTEGGSGITNADRIEMVRLAKELFQKGQETIEQYKIMTSGLAESYGLDPTRVIPTNYPNYQPQLQIKQGKVGTPNEGVTIYSMDGKNWINLETGETMK